jgi:integrase
MSRKKTSPRPSERCGCGDSYRTKRFFFTEEEVKRIINAAAEPERTLYWLAAETGLRAGELFGLRAQDVNLEKSAVTVHQSGLESPSPNSENRQCQSRVRAVTGSRRASPHILDDVAPKPARLTLHLSVWPSAGQE